MTDFERLKAAWTWRPLPNCPGRFVLRDAPQDLDPRVLLGPDADFCRFTVPATPDPVVVARFDDGGLISYEHADGTYVHTLNTSEGFARKLSQLGIPLDAIPSSPRPAR